MDIKTIVSEVNERMAFLESKRENAVSGSRRIIRKTKQIIHSIHLNEDRSSELRKMSEDMRDLLSELSDAPEILHSGVVQDAMTEFAEAFILDSIVRNENIPSFSNLGITAQAWTLGLADTVGEIRRMILDSLVRNDTDR